MRLSPATSVPSPSRKSPAGKSRRVHIHRRRSRWHRLRHVTLRLTSSLLLLFLVLSVLLDLCYPRTLSHPAVVQLTSLLRTSNHTASTPIPSSLLLAAGLPTTHHITRTYTRTLFATTPPLLVHTLPIYYTPVESLTLLTLPQTPVSVIHPSSSARLHLHNVHSTLQLTSLGSGPRASFALHIPNGPALVLVYSDGPQFIAHLTTAVRVAILTADPTHIYTAFVDQLAESAKYVGRIVAASIHHFPTLPDPLRAARDIAAEARRRASARVAAQ